MSCSTPNNSSQIITLYSYTQPTTTDCGCDNCGCDGGTMDAKCIFYTGPNLPCALINTNDSIEDALIKLDQRVCTLSGNYTTYYFGCLDDTNAIINEQQFVEAISTFVCTLRTDFDTFTGDTFPTYEATTTTRFLNIENPLITCDAAGITTEDELSTVYEKYCTTFTDIYAKIAVDEVIWDSCYTVDPNPTSIKEGFDTLISQICQIQSAIEANGIGLPTFNNVDSCLGGTLTAADTLEDTVNKLKDRLCETPVFDINDLSWNCITQPTISTTDLQSAFQSVLDKIDLLTAAIPTFSGDFSVALVDEENTCSGVLVALAPTSVDDKWVAIDNDDADPGTLSQKITAGTNITLDIISTPGTMIINASSGGGDDVLVKANVADTTAGYLEDKIEGSDDGSGITVTKSYNATDDKVTIGTTVDFETFWEQLLQFLDDNDVTKAAFCERVQSCLPDCIIPPTVTVIYQDTAQTTTSTTTTTTTT